MLAIILVWVSLVIEFCLVVLVVMETAPHIVGRLLKSHRKRFAALTVSALLYESID